MFRFLLHTMAWVHVGIPFNAPLLGTLLYRLLLSCLSYIYYVSPHAISLQTFLMVHKARSKVLSSEPFQSPRSSDICCLLPAMDALCHTIFTPIYIYTVACFVLSLPGLFGQTLSVCRSVCLLANPASNNRGKKGVGPQFGQVST